MNPETPSYWRKCTSCKKLILFGQKYWICSVSTCNRQRTGLIFCSVECFDAHVPVLNHREAGAIEKRAPTQAEMKQTEMTQREPQPSKPSASPQPARPQSPMPAGVAVERVEEEILVVVSKVKDYVRKRSEMNTSDRVMDVLSRKIRAWANDAIRRAEQEDRKTVLDRDFR